MMYFKDHAPHHFHAAYGEYNAIIAVNDFAILDGSLPPKALALTMEWASLHQAELRENWKTMIETDQKSFKKIAPLT